MTNLNKTYWDNRYAQGETKWDLGSISKPLKTYFDQLTNKNVKILIPGGGFNYEAEYLWNLGFENIYIVDIAESPLRQFKKRVPDFPKSQIINTDFFKLEATFDLIIEQTFFCALLPKLRPLYSEKMNQLLNRSGKLIGLLFNFDLTEEGPPFGGSRNTYKKLFSKHFTIKTLERARNSEKPRENKELFFIFEKIELK